MEYIVFWTIIAVIAGLVASSKGRSGMGWFLLCFLLSPLMLLLVALLPAVDTRAKQTCIDCGEDVLSTARVCKHCGRQLAGGSSDVMEFKHDEHRKSCPDCGEKSVKAARKCINCGWMFH